jgi:hypothetical protein
LVNAVLDLAAEYTRDQELIFEHQDEVIFKAGKEFRHFDTCKLTNQTKHVLRLVDSAGTHVFLNPDDPSSYRQYVSKTDLNGHFRIQDGSFNNAHLTADYHYVHFTLSFPKALTSGSIYVFGGLTHWGLLPEAQMQYNPEQEVYQTTMLLKQGYYDYQYIFVEDGAQQFNLSLVEGNSFKTENDYTIFIYGQPSYQNYESLIGVQYLNSRQMRQTGP